MSHTPELAGVRGNTPPGVTPEITEYFSRLAAQQIEALRAELQIAPAEMPVQREKPSEQERTVAKLVRSSMKNFTGKDRRPHVIRTFMENFERYSDLMRLEGMERGVAFSAMLEDDAAIWYQSLGRTYGWDEFREEFLKRFRDPQAEENARAQLHKIQQVGSAKKYTEEFKRLAACVPDLTEADKLQTYKRGLKPSLRHDLTVMKIKNFDQAVTEAEELDEIAFQEQRRTERPPEKVRRVNEKLRDRKAPPAEPKCPKDAKAQERQELRAKGACFYCKQLGHIALACPNKTKN